VSLVIAAGTAGTAVAVVFVAAAVVAVLIRVLDRNDLEHVSTADAGELCVADLFAAADEFSVTEEPDWWLEFERGFADYATAWRRGRRVN
jgi:hypothetical protein